MGGNGDYLVELEVGLGLDCRLMDVEGWMGICVEKFFLFGFRVEVVCVMGGLGKT